MAKKLEMKVEKDLKLVLDYITINLLCCMTFWNNEGLDVYQKNIDGKLGSEQSNKQAREMKADDFLLEQMFLDCKSFTRSKFATESENNYQCGRTKSHVWVHVNDNRVLMFYF